MNNFEKRSILNVWKSSEYVSAFAQINHARALLVCGKKQTGWTLRAIWWGTIENKMWPNILESPGQDYYTKSMNKGLVTY